MSRERAKGTRWETKVATWLRDEGFRVFRQPAHGVNDKGDLHIGRDVIVECKDQARHSFAEWADEASAEAASADRPVGIVCAHRRGKGSPADAYWILDGRSLAWLLREAGVELDALSPPNARSGAQTGTQRVLGHVSSDSSGGDAA